MSLIVIRCVADAKLFFREGKAAIGKTFVVEVRCRGQKANQALTTFYADTTFYHFLINGEDDLRKFPDGTLVEAECTGITFNHVYAKFLKTCSDDVYPPHRIVDFPYFFDNKADIIKDGARIIITVEGSGFNDSQAICTMIDYDSVSVNGVRFVVNYIAGMDSSLIGQDVQAIVTGTKPNPLGLTVFCSFVCFPGSARPTAPRAQYDPAAQQKRLEAHSQYLNSYKVAEDAALAALRNDLQAQQEAGEASAYGLEVAAYRALREQGINTEPLLQLYALHSYMVQHDYTLAALKKNYPKVFRFWKDATTYMQMNSEQYQANKDFMKNLSPNFPDWMATLRFTDDHGFRLCTYHNGCNQQGYGVCCEYDNNCDNPHRCMLCDSDTHGLFHYSVVGNTTRKYKCAKLEKYYAELAALQEKWVYKGRAVSEDIIQQLFGVDIPLTLLPLLREMHYERLVTRYRAWRKESDRVDKQLTYSESAKPAKREKLEERHAKAAATYQELQQHNLFFMLMYREIQPRHQQAAAAVEEPASQTAEESTASSLLVDPSAVQEATVQVTRESPSTLSLSLSLEDIRLADSEGLTTSSDMSNAATPNFNLSDPAVQVHAPLTPLSPESPRTPRYPDDVDENEDKEAEEEEEDEEEEEVQKQPVFEYEVDKCMKLIFSDDPDNKYPAGSEVYKALVVNKITGVTDAVVVKLFPMPFNQKKSDKIKITDILRTEMAVIQKMKSPFVVEYRAYAEIQYPDYPGNRWYRALIIKQEDMSFDQFIQRHMQLTDEQYFEKMRPIFKQLVLAYTAIHAENIIHRDVKPDNILVSITASGEAQVKVCDFGLSKFQETLAKGTENLTKTSNRNSVIGYTCVGTVHNGCWYSPEVLKIEMSNKASSYKRSSDVWPLGLVFFFLASRGFSPIICKEDTMLAATDNSARLGFLHSSRGAIIKRANRGKQRPVPSVGGDWRLQDQSEALFDLVEKMVRPVEERIPLAVCGLHPFFWDNTVVVRVVHEYVKEVNTERLSMSHELARVCQPFLHKIGGWNRDHPMFSHLLNREEYKINSPDNLLRALRNVLEHPNVPKNLSARAYQEEIVNTFRALYTPVLLRFFEVTLQTDATGAKMYGEWTGQFTESFQFTFRE